MQYIMWREKIICFLISFIVKIGTLFLELWKRKRAELAYQWDVSDFEEQVRQLILLIVITIYYKPSQLWNQVLPSIVL